MDENIDGGNGLGDGLIAKGKSRNQRKYQRRRRRRYDVP